MLDVLFPYTSTLNLLSDTKYYGYDASTHPENIDRIGKTEREPIIDTSRTCFDKFWDTFFIPCTCFGMYPTPNNFKKLSEEPATARARQNRIQAFQTAANDIIKVVPSELTTHFLDDVIDSEKDEIIASLSATKIVNFPATTDNVVFNGSMQVSLVRSKEGHKPCLLFSVNQGDVKIRVHEFFTYLQSLCCGMPCGDLGGNFGSLYQAKSVINHRFYVLELDKVSDSDAYREFARSVKATSGNIDKPCYLYCINLKACLIQIGLCQICSGCPCFQCSRYFNDRFEAEDEYKLGTEPPLNTNKSFLANSVGWSLETDGNQFNNVSFRYKAQNGKLRVCKLKLAFNQTFEDAKRFAILMRSVQ